MRVRNRNEILERLRAHAAEMRSLGVQRLDLFGSFITDRHCENSDVDLLVEFSAGSKSFDRFLALAERLESILERPVDLLTPESLSTPLGRTILDRVENVPLGA